MFRKYLEETNFGYRKYIRIMRSQEEEGMESYWNSVWNDEKILEIVVVVV